MLYGVSARSCQESIIVATVAQQVMPVGWAMIGTEYDDVLMVLDEIAPPSPVSDVDDSPPLSSSVDDEAALSLPEAAPPASSPEVAPLVPESAVSGEAVAPSSSAEDAIPAPSSALDVSLVASAA